jgi:tRNA (mo5U34)-methyltransferase
VSKWSKENIKRELEKYAEWFSPFDLGYGIQTNPIPIWSLNLPKRKEHLFGPLLALCGGSLKRRRVLDVGCNEGYWSFEASKAGADFVLGIEARSEFIEKANFVTDVLGTSNVEFKQLNVYQLSEEHGQFDVVLIFGLLHHLSEPVGLLRKIRALTREYVVIDTDVDHYTPPTSGVLVVYREYDPRHGGDRIGAFDEEIVLIPTMTSLYDILEAAGFVNVRFLQPGADMPANYLDGTRIGIIAEVPRADNTPHFSTLTPRYYRPAHYRLHRNVTIGPPWDTPSGVLPPVLYCCRAWIIQRPGNCEVQFSTKAPVGVDIVLDRKIVWQSEINGTGSYTMRLEAGQTIEPRIISNDLSILDKVTQIRITYSE